MRTSGLFTKHAYTIPCKSNETFKLVFFGDIHRDSPSHAHIEWQNFLHRAKRLPPSTRFVGMGDYLDATSTSERVALSSITDKTHETLKQKLEVLHMKDIEDFAAELEFARGRIVGLLNGNHYFSFMDGTNSDQKLCGLLGCKYLGVSSFVRLYLRVTKTQVHAFDLWLHHGAGAGRLMGSSINRVEQMREIANANAYAMGDDHAKIVIEGPPRLTLAHNPQSGLEVREEKCWLIRSGSFLKSYTPDTVSYIHDRARGPRSLGHVELILTPRLTKSKFALEVHGWA